MKKKQIVDPIFLLNFLVVCLVCLDRKLSKVTIWIGAVFDSLFLLFMVFISLSFFSFFR